MSNLQGFHDDQIRTCKVFRPIARRLSNSTRRTQVRTDDKGLYLNSRKQYRDGLYNAVPLLVATQRSPARLAGTGDGCHLQGIGGGSE